MNNDTKDKLEILIEDYLSYIKLEKKLSKNTILNYKLDLDNYQVYLKKNRITNPNNITLNDINTYLKYLKDNKLDARTIARHITVIKEFHKYLLRVKEVKEDITLNLENIKVAKKIPNILNDHDLNLVLDVKTDNAFNYGDLMRKMFPYIKPVLFRIVVTSSTVFRLLALISCIKNDFLISKH